MIEGKNGWRAGVMVSILLLIASMMWGCSFFSTLKTGSAPQGAAPEEEAAAAPLYYDFGDILIPNELKVDKKSSFIFRTPGLSAGVLVLRGRVEGTSLVAFFENNMAKDNWQPVSSFKSPRTIMLFKKENRWCVINITEKEFSTIAEIWVAPNINQPEAGLLK